MRCQCGQTGVSGKSLPNSGFPQRPSALAVSAGLWLWIGSARAGWEAAGEASGSGACCRARAGDEGAGAARGKSGEQKA